MTLPVELDGSGLTHVDAALGEHGLGFVASALQVHGAIAFALESGLHRLHRRARSLQGVDRRGVQGDPVVAPDRRSLERGIAASVSRHTFSGSGSAHLGRGAALSTDGPVRISILAREDCDSRGMALVVVERVLAETGVPAEVEVIEVKTLAQARKLGFIGSPTVRVGGRDVDRHANGDALASLEDRVYRTPRGLAGWPDDEWVREALLLAVAGTTSNGHHDSSATSSATSP